MTDTQKPKGGFWLQYFVAPVIVGLLIFILQFFLQPSLEKKKTIEKELWLEKKEAFIKSIQLVDQKFETLKFNENDTLNIEFKNFEEVNTTYVKLLLLSENQDIPKEFWKFFDNRIKEFSPAQRGEYILLLKDELGSSTNTKPEEIPYFKNLRKE